eukprot:TRINITY_DN10136_c0_g1_i1.p1 TRINITY_DN10136_c0_g1~~TRINITY_DN10136_c0_g1_i1.p1  ORF type:complete len:125 (-),score=13.41 TRINITY_DN10136_c0_g1_i1:28-402(-)
MSHVFLKKEFKTTSGKVSNKKFLTIVTRMDVGAIVNTINDHLGQMTVKNKPMDRFFAMEGNNFSLCMNHDIQKFLEEDIILLVFDIFQDNGLGFVFQYDSQSMSQRAMSASITSKEIFIFRRLQ